MRLDGGETVPTAGTSEATDPTDDMSERLTYQLGDGLLPKALCARFVEGEVD
jgi:hypothetical protein